MSEPSYPQRIFCADTTVLPEDSERGARIVIDLPVLERRHGSLVVCTKPEDMRLLRILAAAYGRENDLIAVRDPFTEKNEPQNGASPDA